MILTSEQRTPSVAARATGRAAGASTPLWDRPTVMGIPCVGTDQRSRPTSVLEAPFPQVESKRPIRVWPVRCSATMRDTAGALMLQSPAISAPVLRPVN
jgi:hypothetical protein